MTNIYRSLLLVIAGATHKELARQIKYLKVENEILRSRISGPVLVTDKERTRLTKFARNLAAKVLHQLVSIVHPNTFLKWVREERRTKDKRPSASPGRRRNPEELRRLIRKLARENNWGYTRIMGELKKAWNQAAVTEHGQKQPQEGRSPPPGHSCCSMTGRRRLLNQAMPISADKRRPRCSARTARRCRTRSRVVPANSSARAMWRPLEPDPSADFLNACPGEAAELDDLNDSDRQN